MRLLEINSAKTSSVLPWLGPSLNAERHSVADFSNRSSCALFKKRSALGLGWRYVWGIVIVGNVSLHGSDGLRGSESFSNASSLDPVSSSDIGSIYLISWNVIEY